jgi:hypothetical protein
MLVPTEVAGAVDGAADLKQIGMLHTEDPPGSVPVECQLGASTNDTARRGLMSQDRSRSGVTRPIAGLRPVDP